jgi:hypothetical protein
MLHMSGKGRHGKQRQATPVSMSCGCCCCGPDGPHALQSVPPLPLLLLLQAGHICVHWQQHGVVPTCVQRTQVAGWQACVCTCGAGVEVWLKQGCL